MNVDDKKVVCDSGEGTAEVGGGTDEGVGGVYVGTIVVGSDGAAAAVIAVVAQGMLLREALTALRPALVAEALRSGIGAPGSLAVIELREALVEARLLPKQGGISEAMVSERNLYSRVLESTSPNATEAPVPGSGEPRPRPPLSPRRFPPRPLPAEDDPWYVEPRLLTSPYAKIPNYRGANSEAQGQEW
jgi:hypothetical protein